MEWFKITNENIDAFNEANNKNNESLNKLEKNSWDQNFNNTLWKNLDNTNTTVAKAVEANNNGGQLDGLAMLKQLNDEYKTKTETNEPTTTTKSENWEPNTTTKTESWEPTTTKTETGEPIKVAGSKTQVEYKQPGDVTYKDTNWNEYTVDNDGNPTYYQNDNGGNSYTYKNNLAQAATWVKIGRDKSGKIIVN